MKNQRGQVSIEFILSFIIGLGFLVMFVSVATNMVGGYLAHYATFNASRAFLTHETNQTKESVHAQSEAIARQVFEKVPLKKFGIKSGELKFHRPSDSNILIYKGAYFTYKRLFTGFSLFTGNAKVNYVSESYLGREPTRQECFEKICQAMGFNTDCNTQGFNATVFDNGC